MLMSEFRRAVDEFPLADYREATHTYGRATLKMTRHVDDVPRLRALADTAWSTLAVSASRHDRELIAITQRFFAAQEFVLLEDKPRYEPYASIPTLRLLLGVDEQIPLRTMQRRMWSVADAIINEQIHDDERALAGRLPASRTEIVPEVSKARLEQLALLQASIPPRFRLNAVGATAVTPTFSSLSTATSPAAAVRYLLVFPQTTCHDESAFIRLIHLAETFFWSTLRFVQAAIVAFRLGDLASTEKMLTSAVEFAKPLIGTFKAVRTMPGKHFGVFRAATGNASAVQSQGWQLLDAHMYGVLPEKKDVLKEIPEVAHVTLLDNPAFVSLFAVHARAKSIEAFAIADEIENLDKALAAWRSFHTNQLAAPTGDSAYLPPEAQGTGGTSGLAYLKSHKPPKPGRVQRRRASAQMQALPDAAGGEIKQEQPSEVEETDITMPIEISTVDSIEIETHIIEDDVEEA